MDNDKSMFMDDDNAWVKILEILTEESKIGRAIFDRVIELAEEDKKS